MVGYRAGSGSVNSRNGSADPDPYQNETYPQHCNIQFFSGLELELKSFTFIFSRNNNRQKILLRELDHFFLTCPRSPVMLGDAKLASDFADAMLQEGIYVIGGLRSIQHKARFIFISLDKIPKTTKRLC